MDDKEKIALPFVTRHMLDFEFATKFELVTNYKVSDAVPFTVAGATKSGTFSYKVVPTVATGTTELRFPLNDLPIWVSVVDTDYATEKGDTYVSVDLAINNNTVQSLCAGYVYTTHGISWPQTTRQDSGAVRGKITSSGSTDPAAGSEMSLVVPTGETWRIISIRFTLVTDANVANRRVHLKFTGGSETMIEAISGTDHVASTTRVYTCYFTGGGATLAEDNDIIIPLPQNFMATAGTTISSQTTNKQAGDNFSFMEVNYERFFEFNP